MARFPDHISMTWINHAPQRAGAGPVARDLAMAVECAADPGRFEEVYRALFTFSSALVSRAEVLALAAKTGIADTSEFRFCIENRVPGRKLDWQASQADRLGFAGTPTWFLNGRLYLGAPSAARLEAIVIAALRDRN